VYASLSVGRCRESVLGLTERRIGDGLDTSGGAGESLMQER
jgi:hypothetical protein